MESILNENDKSELHKMSVDHSLGEIVEKQVVISFLNTQGVPVGDEVIHPFMDRFKVNILIYNHSAHIKEDAERIRTFKKNEEYPQIQLYFSGSHYQ